jgi:hypothetical protein
MPCGGVIYMKTTKKPFSLVFIGVVISLLTIFVAPYLLYPIITRSIIFAQWEGPEAEDEFIKLIGNIQDINSGITLFTRKSVGETLKQKLANYDIWVVNNTEKAILFPDNGFGIKILSYEKTTNTWREISLGVWPGNQRLIVPPDSEEMKNHDIWILNSNALRGIDWHRIIRVFVSGVGEISNKYYAAFQDIFVEKRY